MLLWLCGFWLFREGRLTDSGGKESRRLMGLGLLKRVPGGYAPTKFLRSVCALVLRVWERGS